MIFEWSLEGVLRLYPIKIESALSELEPFILKQKALEQYLSLKRQEMIVLQQTLF